ncbi:MAG: complex I NDUFA9 subunit family protein, partial [Rubrivivax sp.]
MKRVLVLGGTGFVGRALCEALTRHDPALAIVVPTRRLPHGSTLRPLPTVQLLQADLHDDSSLQRLVFGVDAVVNLVAILHGSAAAFDMAHVALPRRLAQACRQAGLRRVLHVSALGVGPDAPSHYLRSKAEGEAVLQAAAADLDLTLLRPSVIFGADDHFLNLFAALQRLAPVLPLAGSTACFQPVWVDDVAAALRHCLSDPGTAGQVYELAGPEVHTLSQLVRLAGRWAGHERPQIALPAWAGRLQALALECLPGPPLLSRDNLLSMAVPNVAGGTLPG